MKKSFMLFCVLAWAIVGGGERVRADVTLQYLLNGGTLSSGDLTYQNFRDFGPTGFGGGVSTTVDPSLIDVPSALTLERTPQNLVNTVGENVVGEKFTFDVVTNSPYSIINSAEFFIAGHLGGITYPGGGDAPEFYMNVTITGAGMSPFSVTLNDFNTGTSPVTESVEKFIITPSMRSLTATVEFDAEGTSFHGDTVAEINNLFVLFNATSAPEPGMSSLLTVMAGFGLVSLGYRRSPFGRK